MDEPGSVEAGLSYTWETLISDLDRCEHGRHSTDSCYGCPDGKSTGNLKFKPGTVIGRTFTARTVLSFRDQRRGMTPSNGSGVTDKLDLIYDAQRKLQQRLGHNFAAMSLEEVIEYIKLNILACTDELHEALNETSWKPWTKGERKILRDRYVGELVDAQHFLFNLMIVMGMSPDELLERYLDKNARNHQRQDDGYTGGKCATCSGELDRGLMVLLNGEKFDSYECRDQWKKEHPAL
jgi:dimeric dUTPase (all-alpha-NTP-PPase superfamily)